MLYVKNLTAFIIINSSVYFKFKFLIDRFFLKKKNYIAVKLCLNCITTIKPYALYIIIVR